MIENVVYENIFIREPIWWAVYIGPQQQHQPDGSGPGCMLFPVDKKVRPRGVCFQLFVMTAMRTRRSMLCTMFHVLRIM